METIPTTKHFGLKITVPTTPMRLAPLFIDPCISIIIKNSKGLCLYLFSAQLAIVAESQIHYLSIENCRLDATMQLGKIEIRRVQPYRQGRLLGDSITYQIVFSENTRVKQAIQIFIQNKSKFRWIAMTETRDCSTGKEAEKDTIEGQY
jgi:hypothetical protein